MALWIELYFALVKSYEEQPPNEGRIRRIYEFAAWSIAQPQTDDVETDLSNAVAVGFIEDLPRDSRVSADLHRWISLETFDGCESLFRYHLSDEDFHKLSDEFHANKGEAPGFSIL